MIAVNVMKKFFEQLANDLLVTDVVVYVSDAQVKLADILEAFKKLPADNTDYDEVCVFTEYTQTRYFQPEAVNMDMLTFIWHDDQWYLKNIM